LLLRNIGSNNEDDEETTLQNLVKLVTDLKETILKQNTIIENNQAELIEIKEEQQALRVQNCGAAKSLLQKEKLPNLVTEVSRFAVFLACLSC
jgi:hypothetical protein